MEGKMEPMQFNWSGIETNPEIEHFCVHVKRRELTACEVYTHPSIYESNSFGENC
jgi:hypothetical protein